MMVLLSFLGMAGIAFALAPSWEDEGLEDLGDNSEELEENVNLDQDEDQSIIETLPYDFMPPEDPDLQSASEIGEIGDDTLVGDQGDDFLAGLDGDDELYGNSGNDTLSGMLGDDILVSAEGNDALFGGEGDDALHSRDGDDLLVGGGGEDSLFGGDGNDTLYGEDESTDYLFGGNGDDALIIGGDDHAYGGSGNDTFVVNVNDAVSEVEIMDFDDREDTLVLLVDEDQADAEVSLNKSENDPHFTELRLDDEVIIVFKNDTPPSLDSIHIVVR